MMMVVVATFGLRATVQTQGMLALLVVAIALVAHLNYRPFDERVLDRLELYGLITAFIILYSGMFYFTDDVVIAPWFLYLVTIVILSVNAMFCFYFAYSLWGAVINESTLLNQCHARCCVAFINRRDRCLRAKCPKLFAYYTAKVEQKHFTKNPSFRNAVRIRERRGSSLWTMDEKAQSERHKERERGIRINKRSGEDRVLQMAPIPLAATFKARQKTIKKTLDKNKSRRKKLKTRTTLETLKILGHKASEHTLEQRDGDQLKKRSSLFQEVELTSMKSNSILQRRQQSQHVPPSLFSSGKNNIVSIPGPPGLPGPPPGRFVSNPAGGPAHKGKNRVEKIPELTLSETKEAPVELQSMGDKNKKMSIMNPMFEVSPFLARIDKLDVNQNVINPLSRTSTTQATRTHSTNPMIAGSPGKLYGHINKSDVDLTKQIVIKAVSRTGNTHVSNLAGYKSVRSESRNNSKRKKFSRLNTKQKQSSKVSSVSISGLSKSGSKSVESEE